MATTSRIVSWTIRPSAPSSTKGSPRSRSNASGDASSGSIAASSDRVGRRTTDAASRARRVDGSRPERYSSVRRPTIASIGPAPRSRSVPVARAAAANRSESGWPRASRSIRSRSTSPTPSRRRTSKADSRGRLPNETASNQSPKASRQSCTGGSRPASTRRVSSGITGTKAWRSQRSSGRRSSYRSMTRTKGDPRSRRPAAIAVGSSEPNPVAADNAHENPRAVGSTALPSSGITRAPPSRAIAENDSTRADLPTPPIPWMKTTRGPSSARTSRRVASSSSRPTSSASPDALA